MTLSADDLARVATTFGVGEEQVRRDHAISHVLAAISEVAPERFLFYGGTALSRTWLPDVRLSEDVDLMVFGSRREVGADLELGLRRRLARGFGIPQWDVRPSEARDAQAITMTVEGGVGRIAIKFQLVDTSGRPPWPFERRQVEQRYSDAPEAVLQVPTRPAAVAMKLTAWIDRRAARDLYDLWAMAFRGFIDGDALALFRRYGQTSGRVAARHFDRPPDEMAWRTSLAHQCVLEATADEAMTTVRRALDRLGALDGAS